MSDSRPAAPGPGGRRWSVAAVSVPLVALALLLVPAASPALTRCPGETGSGPAGKVTFLLPEGPGQGSSNGGLALKPTGSATRVRGGMALSVRSLSVSGRSATVGLRGGIAFVRAGREVRFRLPVLRIAGDRAWMLATGASGRVAVLRFRGVGSGFSLDPASVRFRATRAGLTPEVSTLLRRRLGASGTGPVVRGMKLSARLVSNPVGESPPEPPVLIEPVGATPLASGSIEWSVRQSWISYVSSGDGALPFGGVLPVGPAAGPGGLDYLFSFPFDGGWVSGAQDETALVRGGGGIAFRHCFHGINFTLSDPEIELTGSEARAIFTVEGLDNTPFSRARAVVLKLVPERATIERSGDLVTYRDIPAFVPAASTGIFADFYASYPGTPDGPAADAARFGSMTISFTRSNP